MCGGPTDAQNQNQQAQAAFYNKQIQAYDNAYSQFSDIQNTLKQQFAPILAAGPGQYGYTPAEDTALRTQSTEGTAQAYAAAQKALQQRIATLGGGTSNANITGGPMTQVQGQLASTAAGESASENLGITSSGYDLGRQLWQNAVQGYTNLGSAWNPNSFAGSTISAGTAAGNEANTIAQQQNQIWGSILGGLGGIAGSAAGGWALGGFKSPGSINYGGGTSTNELASV